MDETKCEIIKNYEEIKKKLTTFHDEYNLKNDARFKSVSATFLFNSYETTDMLSTPIIPSYKIYIDGPTISFFTFELSATVGIDGVIYYSVKHKLLMDNYYNESDLEDTVKCYASIDDLYNKQILPALKHFILVKDV